MKVYAIVSIGNKSNSHMKKEDLLLHYQCNQGIIIYGNTLFSSKELARKFLYDLVQKRTDLDLWYLLAQERFKITEIDVVG